MRRRALLAAGLALAIARSLPVRAQDPGRQRRVGVLMNTTENDPVAQSRRTELAQALKDLGWVEGRNLRLDVRWGGNDAAKYRKYADESGCPRRS